MVVVHRHIFVQSSCWKFSLFRAFRKHRLIEDAMHSVIQCIIWCTHKDKTIHARGVTLCPMISKNVYFTPFDWNLLLCQS